MRKIPIDKAPSNLIAFSFHYKGYTLQGDCEENEIDELKDAITRWLEDIEDKEDVN